MYIYMCACIGERRLDRFYMAYDAHSGLPLLFCEGSPYAQMGQQVMLHTLQTPDQRYYPAVLYRINLHIMLHVVRSS